MNVEEVLGRLHGVRRSGSGWMARCPAHADRSPSLSIREAGGRILIHCFAGCSIEAVCDALQIKLRDLFAKPCERSQENPVIRNAQIAASKALSPNLPRSVRDSEVIVIYTTEKYVDAAIARALAICVEHCELAQVVLKQSA